MWSSELEGRHAAWTGLSLSVTLVKRTRGEGGGLNETRLALGPQKWTRTEIHLLWLPIS